MARLAFALIALFASVAAAQDLSLGDPITFRGVEVSGLRRGHASRMQFRGDVRISIGGGRLARGGVRTTVRVCDADAVRIEAEMPGVRSVRVQIPGGGPSGHLITPERPRTTYVWLVLPRGDRWVSIEWSVPTVQRSRWRALEDAFFASVHCVD